MKKECHNLNADHVFDLESDRRYRAAVVRALADRVSAFAGKLAIEGRDSDTIHTLSEEVGALQEAMPRALTELNNTVVQEYMAKERAGLV